MSNLTQAIILAGGRGTRLAEQTYQLPKPLVRVGNIPIIVHIINHLASYGVEHIVVAGGYKVEMIREYFTSDEFKNQGESLKIEADGTVSTKGSILPKGLKSIQVVDTGLNTGTAHRIEKAQKYLPEPNEPFFMTYGDTVSDVNLDNVADLFFKSDAKLIITAVPYKERFGILKVDPNSNNLVTKFAEKSTSKDEFVNGGFMAMDSESISYIYPEDDDFSKDTLPRMQQSGVINAYVHTGFWAAMDTQRDNEELNELYDEKPELFKRAEKENDFK